MRPRTAVIILCIFLFNFWSCTESKKVLSITEINPDHQIEIPVEIDPAVIPLKDSILVAQSVGVGGQQLTLQKAPALFSSLTEEISRTFCTILPRGITAGEWTLTPAHSASPFTLQEAEGGQLKIFERGRPVLTYNFDMQWVPTAPERYRRACYLHPVYDLVGRILTDDFPADHFHHRGISWMWPKVFVNGERYDLWHIYGANNEFAGIHQVFEEWLFKETGPVCATIGVKNKWVLDDQRKVMDEWLFLRVFRSSEQAQAIDIALSWRAVETIMLEGQDEKGYGGFNFRFAPREETIITTPAGIETEDSNLKPFAWADQAAKFGGGSTFSGAAIFQHAANPGFPAGWCLRHYGFLGVTWPGVVPFKLAPHQQLTLRFRVWIHKEDATTAQVELADQTFREPPQISLRAD